MWTGYRLSTRRADVCRPPPLNLEPPGGGAGLAQTTGGTIGVYSQDNPHRGAWCQVVRWTSNPQGVGQAWRRRREERSASTARTTHTGGPGARWSGGPRTPRGWGRPGADDGRNDRRLQPGQPTPGGLVPGGPVDLEPPGGGAGLAQTTGGTIGVYSQDNPHRGAWCQVVRWTSNPQGVGQAWRRRREERSASTARTTHTGEDWWRVVFS